MTYTGWISNVSGKLFFHLSEPWNYRIDRIVGDVLHFDEKINKKRYIIISLLADLRDFDKKNAVKYNRIIFLAKEEDAFDGKILKGFVYIISNKNDDIYTKEEQYELKKLSNNIDIYTKLLRKDRDRLSETEIAQLTGKFPKYFTEDIWSVWQDYKEKDSYKRAISFVLDSYGFIELKNCNCDSVPVYKDDILQVYYFIKFIFHNHVHHDIASEDVLDIYDSNSSVGKHLLKDIKKYIAEKRTKNKHISGSDNIYIELTGMLAYAKTLGKQLVITNRIPKSLYRDEKSYFSNLKESILAHISSSQNSKRTTSAKVIDTFLKLQMFIFSILTPYFLIESKGLAKNTNVICYLNKHVIPIYFDVLSYLIIVVLLFDFIKYGSNSFIFKVGSFIRKKFLIFLKRSNLPTLKQKQTLFDKLIFKLVGKYQAWNVLNAKSKSKYTAFILIVLIIIKILYF